MPKAEGPMDDAIEADEEVAQERVNEIGKSEINLSSIIVEDARSLGTKRTVSALILPPQRQDSIGSIESIMEVVRERVGMLQGTITGGLLAGSEAEDWNPRWKGSPKTTRFSEESPSFYMPSPSRALESPKRQQTAKSTPASRFRNREVPDEEQNPFQVGVPFRCAVMCPTVIMLVAFILVFVPLALFSLDTQRATFRNYAHSVATQKELISSIVLNATQWVLLEASKSVEQAVFVGIVEPPDRAVDTLTGAIRMSRSRDGWDFTSALQRRGLSHRAWEELNNQWTCTQLNNNLCSGRALSLYAALDEEEVMGAAFRPSYWAQTLAKEAPFLLDAPAMKGKNTTLSVYEAHSEHGARGEFFVSRPIRPTQMPFYLTQVKLAQKAMSASAKNDAEMRAEAKLKKMWSPVYLFHPWWEGENASTGGQLALSWTTPLAMCGNYSCVDGVVAADTTLDLVSYELALAWYRLQSNLQGPPWSFQLSEQNSSIFIVKQLAPMFPDQEGLLIGASDFRSALVEGKLIHATESPSKIVAATAKAVLRRFGAWNASELTRRGKEQSFHFSLRDAHEGKWKECHPLVNTKGTPEEDKDWEENCFQATTHTIFLDDSLQWLVVASLPAAAFSKFYVDEAMKVEMQVKREQMEAHEKQRDTLIECGFLGILAAAMVLVMGLVTSILVLRPLSRLSLLMRRLTELDFAHDSVEYRKMQDGQAGRILEINELSHGFCRLSHSIEVFARFVPDSVVRRLISGDPKASRLNVLRKDVTIMFSDVRDFTSISEELKQDDLILLLTVYLSVMTRIIESFEGVVGEILGDGILAFWNTPDDVSSHSAKACAAALSQQQALGPLNEEFQKLGLPALAIRIGIHTGEVLTGNIGCLSGKMKFGCMGDPVNLASRLEGLCKTYGVGVLCSQTTRDRLPPEDGFVCRKLDLVQVKGKKEPTVIYEVIGRDLKGGKADDTLPMNTKQPILPERPTLLSSPCVSPRKLRHKIGSTPEVMCWEPVHPNRITQAQMYEEAWTAYSKQKFSEATHLASQLLEERPEDVAAQRLFKRSASLAAKVAEGTDPAFLQELAEWTAVASMTEK